MGGSTLFLQDDSRILEGIRRGDEESLVTLYRLCDGPVRRHVLGNNGTQDDAADMLQEALVILWERVRTGRFEHRARLSTFVVGTVRRLWLRRLARARRELRDADPVESAQDGEASPLETLMHHETTLALQDALRKLGEPCRTLLLLFYWDEASMEEIAARLGFANAETAKARKYQCKKALRQMLEGHDRPH
jgi:RNA polymerase sigma factor (sigma-70 family)